MDGEEEDEEVDGVEQTDGASSPGAASPKPTSRDQFTPSEGAQSSGHQSRRKQLAKQGSVLSNYFGSGPGG